MLTVSLVVLLSYLPLQYQTTNDIAAGALMNTHVLLCAGDALAAAQRNLEALAMQLDPHTGESARLAAMVHEAESTLFALQARTFSLTLCIPSYLAHVVLFSVC